MKATEGTRNFQLFEFACQCGNCSALPPEQRNNDIQAELLAALQQLRDAVGLPIHITSGYRCPTHPETRLNPASQHAKGRAADIWIHARPEGPSLQELWLACEAIPAFRGIGVDRFKRFIHVDVRPAAQRVRWMYLRTAARTGDRKGRRDCAWNQDGSAARWEPPV